MFWWKNDTKLHAFGESMQFFWEEHIPWCGFWDFGKKKRFFGATGRGGVCCFCRFFGCGVAISLCIFLARQKSLFCVWWFLCRFHALG